MHIPTYIGRCRARLSALALSVIALTLLGGCSQARPDRGDEASTVSDDVLVHYLRQQIDTDAAQDAPDASYADYIAPQDYPAQQERM